MKKTYIIPALNVVQLASETNLMVTSVVVDAEKSGGNALIKGDDWDVWGNEDDAYEE